MDKITCTMCPWTGTVDEAIWKDLGWWCPECGGETVFVEEIGKEGGWILDQ